MTEEFDEVVVFENSPLFHYLHDLGHTDFEACPTGSQDEDGGGEGAHAPPPGTSQKLLGSRLWRLANALWRLSPIGQAATCQTLEQELDGAFGQYVVRCILDLDVLLLEDVELIELLDPGLLTLGSSSGGSPGRSGPLPRPALLASPSLWDMAGLLGLAAVLLGLCSAAGLGWSLASPPLGLAFLGWIGLRGARLWTRGRMQRALHTRAAELQMLVHNSKALTGVSRKALRLVQETEVISRGFTLVSAANSFSRAAPGAEPGVQQLIGLRKALYRTLRAAFRASRRATCHMLKAFPLNSEIDNVTNYVSAVPLKELGLGLGVEHVGDEQAQELTDDYSLPALKLLFQLWVAQSSECFRRLALLLSSRRQQKEPTAPGGSEDARCGSPAPPALHCSIATVTEPLRHALAGCLGEVQRSYDFHRYFENQSRAQGSDRAAGRASQKCRELNSLHTSIRSLQLHLKALLSEMIIMEDDLEKMMVCGGRAALSGEGYQELSQRLDHLQPHMQASTSCWEDTVGQVERMLRRTDNVDRPQQCPSAVFHIPTCTPSYPLILDREPVPEELEWEAYVSGEDEDGSGSWCDLLSPEERERQRREREESRRVLSELKAVLGFRASEGERMKRKQLLFNDRAAATPLSGEESSGAPSSAVPLDTPILDTAAFVDASNHLSDSVGEGDGQDEEEDVDEEQGQARAETECEGKPATEFLCGVDGEEEEEEEEEKRVRHVAGSELYQYDGLSEGEAGGDVPDCFLRFAALSTMDRLTELHGAEALSISSALAAQVASRSHALIHMEEQTFGDDDDNKDEDYYDDGGDEGVDGNKNGTPTREKD